MTKVAEAATRLERACDARANRFDWQNVQRKQWLGRTVFNGKIGSFNCGLFRTHDGGIGSALIVITKGTLESPKGVLQGAVHDVMISDGFIDKGRNLLGKVRLGSTLAAEASIPDLTARYKEADWLFVGLRAEQELAFEGIIRIINGIQR